MMMICYHMFLIAFYFYYDTHYHSRFSLLRKEKCTEWRTRINIRYGLPRALKG